MKKMLVVKLLAKGSVNPLFERDILFGDKVTLDNFFLSVIDSLDVLYATIPHDVVFEISEL